MQEAKRILVIDDERTTGELIRSTLQPEGFEVTTASNATEALKILGKESFNAVVLDLILPDMNGILLFRQIRKHNPRLARRVLFLIGIDFDQETIQKISCLSAGCLTKPLDRSKLLAGVLRAANGGIEIRTP